MNCESCDSSKNLTDLLFHLVLDHGESLNSKDPNLCTGFNKHLEIEIERERNPKQLLKNVRRHEKT